MTDLLGPISTAISLAKRLREISVNIRDAELKNLLADLTLQLAEVKMQVAALTDENLALKARVRELEHAGGEPCPKCRKRTLDLVDSRPDPIFGDLGAVKRTYACASCGFNEDRLVDPVGR